jgi:Protein of unknown function (DUF3562)
MKKAWHQQYNHRTAATRPPEAAQHGAIIEALARETGTEPAKVQELYEREYADLEATATVRGFLSVLASRNVRAVLRHRHHY